MPDVLKLIGRVSWDGVDFPITGRSMRFSRNVARFPFVYKDRVYGESTGLGNWVFIYTIPFREGIVRGPYKQLFLKELPKFLKAARDTDDVKELYDPVLGIVKARVLEVSDETDVQKRDGDDVQVQFEEAPDLEGSGDQSSDLSTITGLADEAGALDASVANVAWKQKEPPEATVDPLAAVEGLISRGQQVGAQFSAKIDQAANRLERLEDALVEVQDVSNAPGIRSTRRLADSVYKLRATMMSPGRRVDSFTLGSDISVSALAAQVSNTLTELLSLNPPFATAPTVPKGALVYYYG